MGVRPISTRRPDSPFAYHRAHADTDGQSRHQGGRDRFVGVQYLVAIIGHLCKHHRPQEPEPGNAQNREQYRTLGCRGLPHSSHYRDGIPAHPAGIRSGRRSRNEAAGKVSGRRQPDYRGSDQQWPRFFRLGGRQEPSQNEPEGDRHKGAHLHQAIGAHKFGLLQVLGNDGVLDRSEERGLGAHEEQDRHYRQNGTGCHCKAAQEHDAHFGDLDSPGQNSLVAMVGDFAGPWREQKEGERKQGGAHIGQCVGRRRTGSEDDQHDHGVAVYVVVERAQRLGQEKRRKPLAEQQGKLPAFRACRRQA